MVRELNRRRSSRAGFTLMEVLVVIAIIVILLAVTIPSLQGTSDAGRFNQSVGAIAGILEEARAYASARDTYVWTVFYPNAPASGPLDLYAVAYASSDGTDPLNWSGTVAMPSPGTYGSTSFVLVTKLYRFKGLHLVSDTSLIPDISGSPNFPASTPTFQYTVPGSAGIVLPGANSNPTCWVVQFTPNGMARNGPNPIGAIWMGLQIAHSQTNFDNKNVAGIEINGLTGMSTVNRSQ